MKKHSIAILALTVLTLTGGPKLQAQNGPPPATPSSLITYQGKLEDYTVGRNDDPRLYQFRFRIVIPPNPCPDLIDCGWSTNCPDCTRIDLGTNSVLVDKGLFTTYLKVPAPPTWAALAGGTSFLEIAVRTNSDEAFTTLSPMQPLTATPFATVAQSVVGPVDASNLIGMMPTGMLTGIFSSPLSLSNPSNIFAGDGSRLTHVDAATIGGMSPCDLPCFWKTSGNTGTDPSANFLGTKDNVGLTIGVANSPALRISRPFGPGTSPNIVGGDAANIISSGAASVIGGGGEAAYPNTIAGDASVIAGGRGNHIEDQANFIGGGLGNSIDRSGGMPDPIFDVIGGGWSNINSGAWSTIGGGGYNKILLGSQGESATIAGGYANLANGVWAAVGGGAGNTAGGAGFVGGGWANFATGNGSVVAGGTNNTASGAGAAIPGGNTNVASGSTSFAAGNRAKAVHNGAFVWSDSQDADFASTANNQFAVRAQNGVMIQATTTALDLRGDGAIRVAGAGVASHGPVFIHRATAASINGHMTTIDHPLANGDPNAILLVTHNYSADASSTRYETTPVGVWYDGSKWVIYHENTSVAMPVGRAFNVMIIKP